MTKQMAMVFTHIATALDIKEAGLMTDNMEWVKKRGQMEAPMKVNFINQRSMAKE